MSFAHGPLSLPVRISLAVEQDREKIYRARHEIYASELRQHPENPEARLCDPMDDVNVYLTASVEGKLLGFISVTPPGGPLALEKYLSRSELPVPVDDQCYEVRLLTVLQPHRGRPLALLLAYAALRWIEAHGGVCIVAMGRKELMGFYERLGFQRSGREIRSGALVFEVMTAWAAALRERLSDDADLLRLLARWERWVDWALPVSFTKPAGCFHGGAFFEAIGDEFENLEGRGDVINADVLDAWFPPSPKVLEALERHLPWILQTSPPTDCAGMARAIARARGVRQENVLVGAGSSDLIFLAFRHWLTSSSRALILDPTYGEYAHVLEEVIGCAVDRLPLLAGEGYALDLAHLERRLAARYDLVVLVNPNSPTGGHVPRATLESLLERSPAATCVWVDETYVDYVGPGESLERFAACRPNVIVCKSMSKAYALSGARAAYLCSAPGRLESLRALTPPWAVSLPAQIAAVKALEDPDYYAERYRETRLLREDLAARLRPIPGMRVLPAVANFLLCQLPEDGPDAAALVCACRKRRLFLRDASAMGSGLGRRALRIAVKDAPTNARMLEILREVLEGETAERISPLEALRRG